MLTLRHVFPGGGPPPVERAAYVASVCDAWLERHEATVRDWYARDVVPE